MLSHSTAWEYVIRNKRPVLILEDDAVLSVKANDLVQELFRLENVDLVNLEGHVSPKRLGLKKHTVLVAGFSLSRIYRERSGAAAYVIWPEAAKKMLAFTERLSPLADAAHALCPEINRYQLEPAAAIQAAWHPEHAKFVGGSSVSTAERPHFQTILIKTRGKLIRLYCSWMISQNLARGLGKSTKRIVPFKP